MDAKVASVGNLDARPPAALVRAPASAPNIATDSQTKSLAGDVQQAEVNVDLTPAQLRIEIDKASGRFVNTLIDADSKKVLRQYPSETQLAYSRAVTAYMKAMAGESV